MFIRCAKAALMFTFVLCFSTQSSNAQQAANFDVISGSPAGSFTWDVFNGSEFDGPHTPDAGSSGIGSAAVLASENPAAPGGIIPFTQDLYAHLATPTFTVDLSSVEASSNLTSLVVQVAVSEGIGMFGPTNLDASNFSLVGIGGPDEFIDLGVRSQIPGNGGSLTDVQYFWAEWIGVSAASDFDINISTAGQFQTLTAVDATYFNTDTAFNITAVPEPGVGVVSLLFGLVVLRRRRN